MRQNSQFQKQDKIADLPNKTKPPIFNKTANFGRPIIISYVNKIIKNKAGNYQDENPMMKIHEKIDENRFSPFFVLLKSILYHFH